MSKETRKTKDGRYVLRPGEYERKGKKGFDFKYRDGFGHQHTVGALTLQELRKKERSLLRDRVDGIAIHKQRQTVNDFFAVWKRLKRGLKANTFSNYVWMYNQFVSQSLGKKKINEVKESDVTEFYNSLFDKGYAVSTIDSVQTVLHQVFQLAVRDDAIRRNVTENALKELKHTHPRRKKKALTPAELKRFRDVIKDTPWYPVFEVMSWTGMRVGEVAGLRWSDIDEEHGVIHIQRTLVYYKDQSTGRMERRINSTKTPASFRDVPLNKYILDALMYQKEKCKPCVSSVDGLDGFIFSTRFKETQSQQTLNRALKRIVKDANDEKDAPVLLPYFSCHTLRRTYATHLCAAGVNVAVVMYLMGHNDVSTTIEIYTDVQRDMIVHGDEQLRHWMHGDTTDEEQSDEFNTLRQMANATIIPKP